MSDEGKRLLRGGLIDRAAFNGYDSNRSSENLRMSKIKKNLHEGKANNTSALKKSIRILDELGFVSSSTNRPILVVTLADNPSRMSTIGITDFWKEDDRQKYLKKGGHWDAYKSLVYKKHMHQFTMRKRPRNPYLPHVMDINTIRTIKSMNHIVNHKTAFSHNLSNSLSNNSKARNKSISRNAQLCNEISDKCVELSTETKKIKKSVIKAQDSFQKTLHSSIKLSKRDLIRMKNLII